MRLTTRLGAAPALLLAAWLAPAPAAAHPRVDEARRLVAEADFDRAERAFARAEAARDLTRADAIAFYEGRALLAHALHQEERMTADLRRLAALDPEHAFARGLPPEIPAAWTRIRGAGASPLELDVETTRTGGEVRVRASVRGDPGELVRAVKLRVRVASGPWREARGPGSAELTVRAAEDAAIEHRALAIGVGGAIVLEREASAPVGAPAPATPATPAGGGSLVITTQEGETRIEGIEGLPTATDLQRLRELQRLGEAAARAYGESAEPDEGDAEPEPEAEPLPPQITPARGAVPVQPLPREPEPEGETFTISGWAILGIGLVVAAVAVGIYLAVTLESDDTMPSVPAIPGL